MDLAWQARIEELEAREQIKELPAKYVWASARADVPAMMDLFTDDAVFEPPNPAGRVEYKGKAAIRGALEQSVTKPGGILALIHNHTVEVAGDTATGACVMYNPIFPKEHGVFVGYYHDAFRRENGTWLYTARRFYTYSPVLDLSGG